MKDNQNKNTQIHLILKLGLVALVGLFMVASCTNNSQKGSNLNEKIDAILSLPQQNIEALGVPKKYASIANDDTLKMKIADELAKVKINSKLKFFMTKNCLQEKRKDATNETDAQHQFVNDSTYLSLIKTKNEAVYTENFKDGTNFLDAIIGVEKIKLLITEMNKICPTDGTGKLIE